MILGPRKVLWEVIGRFCGIIGISDFSMLFLKKKIAGFHTSGNCPASSHETLKQVFDDFRTESIDFWAQGCSRDVIERFYGNMFF